jgi:hypothetical protein
LNALDGRHFVRELKELRERAGLVDGLEETNMRLRAELDAARKKLPDVGSEKSTSKLGNGEGEFASRSMGTQTTSTFQDGRDVHWNVSHERLMQKHNILTTSYQELVVARNQIESKLRSTQRSSREWIEYANGLEKKIVRLQGKLTSYGISTKRHSEGSSFENIPPTIPPVSHELVPIKTGEASLETLRRELPNILHMSERISELARSAVVETPGYKSPYLLQPASTDRSEQQQEGSGSNDFPLPIFKDPIRLQFGPRASDRGVSTLSPRPLMDGLPAQGHDSEHPASSEFRHSGSTEEDVNILPDLSNREQVDMPPPFIKAEPLSDTPVVLSSRSVKKRKARNDTGSNESIPYTKVKVEIVTSPIGLAGFQSLFPQESMDLDEIGEKMNTPKKRRRAMQNAQFEKNTIAYNKLPAELDQVGRLQQSQSDTQPNRNPLALQPASPNKQILPRTSGKKREPKRRRIGERVRGAVIFGEDGENDVTSKIGADIEIQSENICKLPANAAELQRRLSGLLEEPSPEKEVLTPSRPTSFSAATAQLRARAIPTNTYERATPLNRRHIGAGTTPNTFAISRDGPQSDYKPSTGKIRTGRTPKDIGALEADDTDREPLRARPVRHLGLEHFKINPHFNHGSDYAFVDVVRGRELRKCFPGCTKPECCGDKFRKFVEFARVHEQHTLSQEEQDARLLEEYLGDNRSRLRNMTEGEREELLIQARTRDLANKASKHRHAYERRRSPPGFWRSDFPSTQELQSDRQEAANRERELVQQRYEEAMRPGGRWLFRDE